jgi:hypothetical protein
MNNSKRLGIMLLSPLLGVLFLVNSAEFLIAAVAQSLPPGGYRAQ